MVNVTDIGQSVPIGSPMDPMDHPADSGHNDNYNPGRVADVVPLHPPGTFSRNSDIGDFINTSAKAMGISPPNNVVKLPRK